MKKVVLLAMVAAILFAVSAMAADNSAGLAEYRVVGDTSVSLAEVVDLFIPSLSGGAKFLPPKANGLGLIHRWNPQFADATWKTRLQPGDTLRLPQEWVLRGIQGVLEPAAVPFQSRSLVLSAEQFWCGVGLIIFFVGGSFLFPRFGRWLLFRGKEGAPFNWR